MLFVTNLDDSGPGRLRAALETSGPRTVVFRVSGIIDLKSPLELREPYITIAGQTAPGDGVCLRGYTLYLLYTHDVVIRHLRLRSFGGVFKIAWGRERDDGRIENCLAYMHAAVKTAGSAFGLFQFRGKNLTAVGGETQFKESQIESVRQIDDAARSWPSEATCSTRPAGPPSCTATRTADTPTSRFGPGR